VRGPMFGDELILSRHEVPFFPRQGSDNDVSLPLLSLISSSVNGLLVRFAKETRRAISRCEFVCFLVV
jgi:hypothetical protein